MDEFHLIVQFLVGDNKRESRLSVINAQQIANKSEVNEITCYPGREIYLEIADVLVPAIMRRISDDINDIEEQYIELRLNDAEQRKIRQGAIIHQERPIVAAVNPENVVRPQEQLMDNNAENAENTKICRFIDAIIKQDSTVKVIIRFKLPQVESDSNANLMKKGKDGKTSEQCQPRHSHNTRSRKSSGEGNKENTAPNAKRFKASASSKKVGECSKTPQLPTANQRGKDNTAPNVKKRFRASATSNNVGESSTTPQLPTAYRREEDIAAEESEPGPSRRTPRSETLAVENTSPNAEPAAEIPNNVGESSTTPQLPTANQRGEENTAPNVRNRFRASATSNNVGESSTTPQLPTAYQREEDIVIGSNGTKINAVFARGLDFKNFSPTTRRVILKVFGKETLATHSLSGRQSPAFPGRAAKPQLDPRKVADIIEYVMKNCNVPENAVRNIITAKCADESKMNRNNNNASRPVVEPRAGPSNADRNNSNASSPVDEPRAGPSNAHSNNSNASSPVDEPRAGPSNADRNNSNASSPVDEPRAGPSNAHSNNSNASSPVDEPRAGPNNADRNNSNASSPVDEPRAGPNNADRNNSNASSPVDEPRASPSNTENSSDSDYSSITGISRTDESSNANEVVARDSSSPDAGPNLIMSFKKRIMKNFQDMCNSPRD